MRKIMIISSNYTGHGHKSIADSLCEQLQQYPDVQVKVIDGFSLVGKAGVSASKIYGPITRYARDLWKVSFALSNQKAFSAASELSAAMIYARLVKELRAFLPDLILTVHPFFNHAITDVLAWLKLDIPFIALQADLINIHQTWCNPDATLTLCPTIEAYNTSIRHGMRPEQLEVCGFPTRARFCDAARKQEKPDYHPGTPLRCLLMSGGEGSGNLKKYALCLLEQVDCTLTIICGRNKKLKSMLEDTLLPQYEQRVRILGFIENVQDVMMACDLVIARGSPNTLMEAVVLNVPLLITGSLPGQEADNPAMMIAHNLGVLCENANAAPALISALIANDGQRLKEIRASQRAYRDLDIAKHIAQRLYGLALPLGGSYEAHLRRRLPVPKSIRPRSSSKFF